MFRTITFICLVLISTVSLAQRIKIDKKKLGFLKEETSVGVQLTFPEYTTFFSDRMTEKEFIAYMKKRRGKKDASKGDMWLDAYETAKETTWRQDFLLGINEQLKKYSELRFTIPDDQTTYMMIIEAYWIYPGYGGGASVGREEAKLEVALKFINRSNPETILFETVTPNIIGDYGYGEFGSIVRVGKCYEKLGYLLNLQLKRILK